MGAGDIKIKRENNYIIAYDRDKSSAQFRIPQDTFVLLLHDLGTVYEQRPTTIRITLDDTYKCIITPQGEITHTCSFCTRDRLFYNDVTYTALLKRWSFDCNRYSVSRQDSDPQLEPLCNMLNIDTSEAFRKFLSNPNKHMRMYASIRDSDNHTSFAYRIKKVHSNVVIQEGNKIQIPQDKFIGLIDQFNQVYIDRPDTIQVIMRPGYLFEIKSQGEPHICQNCSKKKIYFKAKDFSINKQA